MHWTRGREIICAPFIKGYFMERVKIRKILNQIFEEEKIRYSAGVDLLRNIGREDFSEFKLGKSIFITYSVCKSNTDKGYSVTRSTSKTFCEMRKNAGSKIPIYYYKFKWQNICTLEKRKVDFSYIRGLKDPLISFVAFRYDIKLRDLNSKEVHVNGEPA